ncbi:MAG: bifunctional precorrin-2 dehydrogenase/sirohydrochlorin ferrochelatase, partial [Gemmataceae bacterium]|nr:bifunctional precorrin-2 dehydrogenase/sirohydrochlorin ferrochelatase [Gemmataceae bacterium]
GGAVGRRKAAAARAAGAAVRVVDPRVADDPTPGPSPAGGGEQDVGRPVLSPLSLWGRGKERGWGEEGGGASSGPGEGSPVEWLPEPYRPDHLSGAALVFACATPEVNDRVAADAKARGVWVNAASDPAAGNIVLPAVVRRGGLTLAVNTGGASPALARRIREKLEAEFDESFAEWVALLDEVRAEVLAAVHDPTRRRELLDGFADWPWLERLRAEGPDAVRAAMRATLP